MRYEDIKIWKDTDFKRLTGVQPKTFAKMLAVLEKEHPNFGRPPKLSRADQLLMTLMYWREYRTQFHIAGSYGISEATVCRTINKIEDAFQMMLDVNRSYHNIEITANFILEDQLPPNHYRSLIELVRIKQ